MHTMKNFRIKTLLFIVVSYIFLIILPSIVCGANWVLVKSDEDNVSYYDSASIKIDKQKKIINVVFLTENTSKHKKDIENDMKNQNLPGGGQIVDAYMYYLSLNYNNSLFYIHKYIVNFGDEWQDLTKLSKQSLNWQNLKSDSDFHLLLIKIIEDYSINK
jgi:hypothetical protein